MIAPLQRAEHLPPPPDVGVDGPPPPPRRRRTAPRRSRSRRPARRAEPPRPHAEPAEVLERVAEVGQLPVEHRPQPVRPDDQVAEAEVAVHDHGEPGGGGRLVSSQRKAELERGMGRCEGVERAAELAQLVLPLQLGGGRQRESVDRRQRPAALRRQPRPVAAYSSSRRMRRAIVSPSTCSTRNAGARGGRVVAARATNGGHRHAPRRAAAAAAASSPSAGGRRPGRSRWRISGRPSASNDQVSRDAPPDSRRARTRRVEQPPEVTSERVGRPTASSAVRGQFVPRR